MDARRSSNRLSQLPIRWQLSLIALVLALPTVFIIVSSGLRSRQEAFREARSHAQQLAADIAFTQQNLVAGAQQLLMVLAQLPELRRGDAEKTQAILRDCLAINGQYSNIFVADTKGRVWASGVPTTPFDVSDRRYFRNTIRSGRFSSGEYVLSRATGQAAFNLGYPLRDGHGAVAGVISVGFSLDQYRQFLMEARLPSGTNYLLLDYAGVVLDRGHDAAALLGQSYEREPFDRMVHGPLKDATVSRAMSGDLRLIAYEKLQLTGEKTPYMYVRVGVPMATVVSRANAALISDLALFVPSLVVALFLALLFAKRAIADRTTQLQRAAERLAAGDETVNVSESVVGGELGGLARTFDDMARQIADRELARRLSEERHRSLTDQLAQAKKMESIGRLAGGVAHDFNNMLSVILSDTELLLAKLPPQDPLRAEIEEIAGAAARSAELTRQLLGFASKQRIAPRIVDLHESVSATMSLLQRLVGENVKLSWEPSPGLWTIRIDPAQLDQIFTNLCVNARDAIADVGRIRIAAENRSVPVDGVDGAHLLGPGDYVRVTVTDDGRGMDAETLAHIFEPFFTTKGPGKGTGLGLATVYGIVQQNGGAISARSAPGEGTTFTIDLPRCIEAATAVRRGITPP